MLFNYRYNPVYEKVFDTIAVGAIGEVTSVHFEWLLDTVHGADYFRRWHRQKENSGGLMGACPPPSRNALSLTSSATTPRPAVHKAGHHFDLGAPFLPRAVSSALSSR